MVDDVSLRPVHRPDDDDALVAFLSAQTYPFHVRPALPAADIRTRLDQGDFDAPGNAAYWVLGSKARPETTTSRCAARSAAPGG